MPETRYALPKDNPRPLSGFMTWLDRRTGVYSLLREALDERIPGGARWAYIFGSGLLYLFVSQVVTGIFIALYYFPSSVQAHRSVSYISKVVGSGFSTQHPRLWRTAFVIVLCLHIFPTLLTAPSRAAHLLWSGCLLVFLATHGLYRLFVPWDLAVLLRFRGTTQGGPCSNLCRVSAGATAGDTDPIALLCVTRFYVARSSDCLHCHAYFLVSQGRPCHSLVTAPLNSQNFHCTTNSGFINGATITRPDFCSSDWHSVCFNSPWTTSSAETSYIPRPEWYYSADVSVDEGGGRQMVSIWWHCSAGAARLVVCCDSIF